MAESIFKWVKSDGLMIAVNTAGNISDELWASFLDEFGAEDYDAYLGGSLGILEVSSAQRKSAAAALRNNGVSVSIVTDDVLVRGVVTAVSWLGADVRSFAWRDIDLAMQRLDMLGRKQEILDTLNELRAEVEAEAEQRQRERAATREQKRRTS